MRDLSVLLVCSALLAASPVHAKNNGSDGRYTMTPTAEGMLRLDTRTGAVSVCAEEANGWVCKSVADDREAMQKEIDRLAKENRRLRDELAQQAETRSGKGEPRERGSWLPSDENVDQLMAFLEKLARRFRDMVDSLKKDETESKL